MSIIRDFTLYLNAGISTPEVVHVNQYDQGEVWRFTLLESDGSKYTPSTGALIGVKADGHAIAGVTGTVLGDGRVSITETQQMTAAAGDAIFELTIDGGSHGSANFIVRVEKKPTDDAILSESDLSIIQEGMNSVTPVVIAETVSDWLEDNLTNPPIDPSLTISNAAADAKVTGDKITELKTALGNNVIGSADDVQLCNFDASGTAVILRTGSLCLASTKRIKIENDTLVDVKCEEGYEYAVAFCNSYGNGTVALNTSYGISNSGNLWKVADEVILIPSTAQAIFVLIRKQDGTAMTTAEYNKVTFYHTIRWISETVSKDIEFISDSVLGKNVINVNNFRVGSLYVSGSSLLEGANNYRVSNYANSPFKMNAGDLIGLTTYQNRRYILFTSADGTSWTQGTWKTSDTVITVSGYYAIVVEDTTQATQTSVESLVSIIKYVDSNSEIVKINTRIDVLEAQKKANKFAHLSFDDVRYCMIDLMNNANVYSSIFENPFFAMLKNLHDTYGTVVSLYLFLTNTGSTIADYPTSFANEFAENSDWLKFGLHQGANNYESTSANAALSDYNTFTANIVNICGTAKVIDRCPRLGSFKGNLNSMLAMRDANGGICGLLSAYDSRDSYYLDSTDSTYLFNHGKLVDAENHLTFYRTIMTMEEANPSTELPKLNTLAGYNGSPYGIIMMHEYAVYNSTFEMISAMVDRLAFACNWMNENGYEWAYPMDKILM